MPPRIFISYRREDAAADAGRLADHLRQRFGNDRVFLDVDAIDPGTDFVQVLHASLEQTAAVLIVIGPRWTALSGADGTRRLDSPADFVRLEVEAALGRTIPVVPVLVQGARMPAPGDLPASLAALATRQAVTLDYDEFHDDATRLCDRLAPMIGFDTPAPRSFGRKWWPAAALATVLAVGFAVYVYTRGSAGKATPDTTPPVDTAGNDLVASDLVAAASAQQRRNQYADALATLARARAVAPASADVRRAQEDVAMEWIRGVRVENGTSSFGEAIRPALDVVDAALPAATGTRRADLLAHTGWATFLLWRDGDRRLDPRNAYQEALSIDPGNPFANAMLAHWTLFQDHDAVAAAASLFTTALAAGRARDAIRTLQWAAYTNADGNSEAVAERIRLANAMRLGEEPLNMRQAQALWGPYYFATLPGREAERRALLDALAPDDHIKTLDWAFAEYATRDESRLRTIRYYVALLHARGGQPQQAVGALRALDQEMEREHATGSLRDAVQAALERIAPPNGARGQQRRAR